ncbi:MAG: class I SAM-dependent methyltransferase [Planctomycetales bacterium]|nr:class I SAM-dependent methyltransferase [Planctomycetales bacterium]
MEAANQMQDVTAISPPLSRTIANNPRGRSVVSCVVCHRGGEHQFTRHGVSIVDCKHCGHRYADYVATDDHVGDVYDHGYFYGGGAGYSDYTQEHGLLIDRGRRYGETLKRYCSAGKLLDVGAAAGFILRGFCDADWTGAGVEPNPEMAEYGRSQLGLTIHESTFEQFETDEQFDLISLIQVLAHFVDPQAAVHQASRLCRTGGHCLIETWNRSSWTARLLGRSWHEYSPPTVLHFFDRKTTDRLMAQAGFRRVAQGRPPKWISIGHARSLIEYKLTSPWLRAVATAPMRLLPAALSVPYPAEDLFWALYQKV